MNFSDLKTGNSALTDEQAQFGLRRAAEISAKHSKPNGNGMKAFRRHFPGVIVLSEIQLAAIIAEAYCDGQALHGVEK